MWMACPKKNLRPSCKEIVSVAKHPFITSTSQLTVSGLHCVVELSSGTCCFFRCLTDKLSLCVCFFVCVMPLSTKGYYSMSPYDDGYVSFMYVCIYACTFHDLLSRLSSLPHKSRSAFFFLLLSPPWLYVWSPYPLLQAYISRDPFVISLDCHFL